MAVISYQQHAWIALKVSKIPHMIEHNLPRNKRTFAWKVAVCTTTALKQSAGQLETQLGPSVVLTHAGSASSRQRSETWWLRWSSGKWWGLALGGCK